MTYKGYNAGFEDGRTSTLQEVEKRVAVLRRSYKWDDPTLRSVIQLLKEMKGEK